MSARRGAVANSGVPQKSTRTLQLLLRMPVLIPVLGGLEGHAPDEAGILVGRELPLGQRGRALEDAQVVEKQFAIEVVDLVLKTAREQFRCLALERLPVASNRVYDHGLGPLHVRIDVGNREAAFLALCRRR